MNIYDTKSIICNKCNSSIDEIEFDATVTMPLCGKCVDPLPEVKMMIPSVNCLHNNPSQQLLLKIANEVK